MTQLKFTGTPTTSARDGLAGHVRDIYDQPGCTKVAVVEFQHVERVQPAPGADKEPTVNVRLTACEIPSDEQSDTIRGVMRALWLQRTARGTLDEDGELKLAPDTMKHAAGMVQGIEVARLRAQLAHWNAYAARIAANSGKFSASELAHEAQIIADGLSAALRNTPEDVAE